jgi:hypothetical protein
MRELDKFSKVIGAMGAFNEMIACGAKNVALGHPTPDRALRDEHMEFAKIMCEESGTFCCEENGGFLTDLFPWSMNKDKFNVLFYKNESYRDAYFALKERKAKLVEDKLYKGDVRREIAWEFGKLLSYSDEAIERMIAENDELEEFDF